MAISNVGAALAFAAKLADTHNGAEWVELFDSLMNWGASVEEVRRSLFLRRAASQSASNFERTL